MGENTEADVRAGVAIRMTTVRQTLATGGPLAKIFDDMAEER